MTITNLSFLPLQAEGSTVHVTVGNQSCDLDSIVASVCHAYHLRQKEGVVSMPLMQCSRADFALRKDAVWLLQQLNLDPSHLLYNEDMKGHLEKAGRVEVTLVDASHLTGILCSLPRVEVVAILDHHVSGEGGGAGSGREEAHCLRVVEGVGSCCTLVAERLLGDKDHTVSAVVATLLLAAVLIDTVNMDPESHRTTDRDRAVVGELSSLALLPREELYQNLFKARFSSTGLSIKQLLNKDLKVVECQGSRLGFSSVTGHLPQLLTGEGVGESVQEFCQNCSLSVLVVLGIQAAETGADTRRWIAVYQSTESDLADAIASILEAEQQLQCEHVEGDFPCILLSQGNSTLSRKHILPLVSNFISTM